jgi:sugar phosphate isomerase/epimerase
LNEATRNSEAKPVPLKIAAFPKCYIDQIAGARTMSVFDWIEIARALDADGLEMFDGFFTSLDDTYIDRVGEAIHSAGFAMPMLCCSPDFTNPDPDARQRAVEREKNLVRVARRLGEPGVVCRVLSGQRYPGVERRQGLDWVIDCIEEVLPVAREHEVVLGLENHYKDSFWQYPEFAQKQDVFLELLAAIPDRDNFGVQYDPSNAIVAGDDPIALLEAVADRVVSMHASDRYLAEGTTLDELRQSDGTLGYSPNLRHGVIGRGLNDYDAIFRILAAHGYRGWVSIEDGMNGMDEMAESLAFLRAKIAQYFPEP